MRDYWLTQYLLAAVGWTYIIVVVIATALALWLPKSRKAKVLAAAIVIGLSAILPLKGYQGYRKGQQEAQAYKSRLEKAQALFAERCKTAGEKIYRTVEGVEGVVWMKWRPEGLSHEQFALDDPYGKDCKLEGCILRLMQSDESPTSERPEGKIKKATYKFIETIDPVDGLRYRYIGVSRNFADLTPDESLRLR